MSRSIWLAHLSFLLSPTCVASSRRRRLSIPTNKEKSSSIVVGARRFHCRDCQGARAVLKSTKSLRRLTWRTGIIHRVQKLGWNCCPACQIWEAQIGRSKERWWWLWRGPHLWWHILLLQSPVSHCKSHAPLNPRSCVPPLRRCAKKLPQLLHWKPVRYSARLHRHRGGEVCTSASFLQPEPVCVCVCVWLGGGGFTKKFQAVWNLRDSDRESWLCTHVYYSVLSILGFLSFRWKILPYPTHQRAVLGFWGYGFPCFHVHGSPICWE